jgi:hypothetical protein
MTSRRTKIDRRAGDDADPLPVGPQRQRAHVAATIGLMSAASLGAGRTRSPVGAWLRASVGPGPS